MRYPIDQSVLETLLIQGETNESLTVKLQCSESYIKKIRKEYGYSLHYIIEKKKERIRTLYNKGLIDKDIAENLGISKHSVTYYRAQIMKLPGHYKTYSEYPLSKFAHRALIGSMLGDGNLRVGKGREAQLNYAHSVTQKEYFFHKYELWKPLLGPWRYYENEDKRTGNVYRKYAVTSKTHPELTRLYKMLYSTGSKQITDEYLEEFDEISLAYLFMDDGNKKYLSTDAFNEVSTKKLCDKIQELGIKVYPRNHKVYIPKNQREILSCTIDQYVIDSLKYKLDLCPLKTG